MKLFQNSGDANEVISSLRMSAASHRTDLSTPGVRLMPDFRSGSFGILFTECSSPEVRSWLSFCSYGWKDLHLHQYR